MGTHPIFESDFDCLTEMLRIVLRTPVKRHARLPAEKIVEKMIDKVVWAPLTSAIKRRMKTNPSYEQAIRRASHWWTRRQFWYHLWKAQSEDGVTYTSEEKERLIKAKLKKADQNIDNLVASFLDLTKQALNFILSIVLTIVLTHWYTSGVSETDFINNEAEQLENALAEKFNEIDVILAQCKVNHAQVADIILENEKLRGQCLQICTDLT